MKSHHEVVYHSSTGRIISARRGFLTAFFEGFFDGLNGVEHCEFVTESDVDGDDAIPKAC